MKRLLVVLMMVALLAAFATPAAAEPNLTIKGEYVVQAFHGDGVASQNQGLATTDDNDEFDYVYQRFRVQPKFKASDNVSAHLRFDFAEGMWGQDQDFNGARADSSTAGWDSDIQVDRAYVDVDMQWVRVRAGLQFVPVGQTQVFRDNQPALQFNIKTGSPFSSRLAWIKASEGIGVSTDAPPTRWSRLSDETDANKDQDRYVATLEWNTDTFAANVFGVMQTDGSTNGVDNFEDEPYVVGFRLRKWTLGSFTFHGEIAQFGGDNGNEVDYSGTQANVNGMWNLGDNLKLGLDLIYSSAQDDGEIKRTTMGNPFAAYDVRFGGTFGWDTMTYGRANGILFTSGTPPGPLAGDVFDPFNTGAGAMGAGLGAMWTPMEKLNLIGQFHYLTADDDDLAGVTGEFENGYNLLLAAIYQLAPKTSLHATYQLVDASFMDNIDPDASNVYSLWMRVNF